MLKSDEMQRMLYVDDARCTGCGACIEACPSQAIALEGGLARIDQARCTACEACVAMCPIGAIEKLEAPVSSYAPVTAVLSPKQVERAAYPALRHVAVRAAPLAPSFVAELARRWLDSQVMVRGPARRRGGLGQGRRWRGGRVN
jgi:Fe-S-cluster-containing hydrogenase component 2